MIRRALFPATCFALLVLAATPGSAKRNNLDVRLEYVPQQTVSQVQVRLERAQRATPLALLLSDGRDRDDPAVIGTRTDDRDREYVLSATSGVIPFVEETLGGLLRDWGIAEGDRSGLRLELELSTYSVRETNQAVGASYRSDVTLHGRLAEAGTILWSGRISGSASRYGRKFSNDNVNEVLSDALLQAFGELISTRSLQKAWSGNAEPEVVRAAAMIPAPSQRDVLAPERLLAELKKLDDGQFETATVLEYLKLKALSRPLNADDLTALKESGVPEAVIRTVVDLPVL